MMTRTFASGLAFFAIVGCGAKVSWQDSSGGGGSGGTGGFSTSIGTTGGNAATTGAGGQGGGTTEFCDEHADCGDGMFCEFFTGECRLPCNPDGGCPTGTICDGCASSSCPKCEDCMALCVPEPIVPCSSNSDCSDLFGHVCVFQGPSETGICLQACGEGRPPCPPSEICSECLGGSCPGCDDCVSACTWVKLD